MRLFALVLAAGATYSLTPVAIAVARRTGFLDRPLGYKKHHRATPYLGGSAVLAGFLIAAVTVSGGGRRFAALLAGAAALWLIGTLDDRIAVAPGWRLLAEAASALVLFEGGLGWSIFGSDLANLVLTGVWIVGLVNAFNLMDNLDGALATVAAVSCAGIAALAVVNGDRAVAALALALAGACAAFLIFNLATPARIFLGDGGSMPIGLLVGGLAVAAANRSALGGGGLVAGALFVGLPILDTTLVSISRRRRGISLLQGGRDHLTHRLLTRLRSPRRVALLLALLQATLGAVAVAAAALGAVAVTSTGLGAALLGVLAIVVLDRPAWRPPPTGAWAVEGPPADAT